MNFFLKLVTLASVAMTSGVTGIALESEQKKIRVALANTEKRISILEEEKRTSIDTAQNSRGILQRLIQLIRRTPFGQ